MSAKTAERTGAAISTCPLNRLLTLDPCVLSLRTANDAEAAEPCSPCPLTLLGQQRGLSSPAGKHALRHAISFLRLLIQDMEAALQDRAAAEPDPIRPGMGADDRRRSIAQARPAPADVDGCDLSNTPLGGPVSAPSVVSPHAQKVVLQMLAHVHQHYTRPLHLGDVAAALHLNAAYLSYLFSSAMGVTFRQYLEQLRLAQAQQLLRDPLVRVSEVAYAVGYTDPNTFRDAFKTRLGLSPSAWRTRSCT